MPPSMRSSVSVFFFLPSAEGFLASFPALGAASAGAALAALAAAFFWRFDGAAGGSAGEARFAFELEDADAATSGHAPRAR